MWTATVLSCRCAAPGCFSDHSVRREVYLIDKDDDHNPALASVVEDCVATIDAWRAEGFTVVVHCHGGASRTGLILRAWLMRKHGWSSAQATKRLKSRWPCLGEWNESFTTFLDTWQGRAAVQGANPDTAGNPLRQKEASRRLDEPKAHG